MHALVRDGRVAEIIAPVDGVELEDRFHPDVLALLVPCGEEVQPGWSWDGTAFAAPGATPAPEPSPPVVTPREFRARFTLEERGALTLAASRALERDDPTLQVFLDELGASQVVELDHPDTLAGMTILVSAGLLTRDRAEAILDGAALPEPEPAPAPEPDLPAPEPAATPAADPATAPEAPPPEPAAPEEAA